MLLLKRRPGDSILRFDGGFDSLDAIKTLQSYGRRSSRAVFYLQYLYTSGWVFIQGAFLAMFPFELLQQARSLLTLATCHSPPPMKTVLCESLSSVCIVGFMYFTELRSCSLTPAQVRKEQDGLVHQADCSFLP